MEGMIMSNNSKVRDFLVGIDFDDPFDYNDSRGHVTLRRKVSIGEMVEELQIIMTRGSGYPQFLPEASPTLTYAYDLNNSKSVDCYLEIMQELAKYTRKEVTH